MPPPTNGDGPGRSKSRRVSHLTLISGGSTSSAPASLPPESPKPTETLESPKPLIDLNTGFQADKLRAMVKGNSLPQGTPFELLQEKLARLANPLPNGGYDATFISEGNHFRFFQEKPEGPIDLIISQETTPKGHPKPEYKEVFGMTYTPNLTVGKMSKPERSYNDTAQNFLSQRTEWLIRSKHSFRGLQRPLRRLKGRPDPANRAFWYDNFVVHQGKIYTLRTQNIGFQAFQSKPEQNLISIFETTENARREILAIAKTGEIYPDPTRGVRLLPEYHQTQIMETLSKALLEADLDPQAYQKKLTEQLEGLNQGRAEPIRVPRIAPAFEVPVQPGATHGNLGEPIRTIHDGREIWRLTRRFSPEGLLWENPNNPGESRVLRPEGAIKDAMQKELRHWFRNAVWEGGIKDWRRIRPQSGSLQLHLYPEGGGELTIFRGKEVLSPDGKKITEPYIHNIVLTTADGRVIDLEKEIQKLGKQEKNFKKLPREVQVQAAADRVNRNLDLDLRLSEVPEIQIHQLHLNPDGKPVTDANGKPIEISDAMTAWELIQRLPQLHGTTARVQMESQGTLLHQLVGPPNMDLIKVSIQGSQPPVRFQIRELNLPAGESGNTKRVEIQHWRGEDHEVAVYDNGRLNEAEGGRHIQADYNAVLDGKIPVTRWKLGLNTYLRYYNYARINGIAYGLGYLGTMPLNYLLELSLFNKGERKLVGVVSPREYLTDLYTRGQKDPWGTLKKEGYLLGKEAWQGYLKFLLMVSTSGTASLGVDGAYNFYDGWPQFQKMWKISRLGFFKALQRHPPPIFNEDPRYRPMGKNLFFRGFLKRSVPLLAGLAALEWYDHGEINRERLIGSFTRVGGVSLASAGMWRLLQSSERISSFLQNKGLLFKPKEAGFLNPRTAPLSFRGTLVTVFLEFLALGVWETYDKKREIARQEGQFREALGRALDAHNRLISRLENGEEIPPRQLFSAVQELQETQAHYHRFLELVERRKGDGPWIPLDISNAYQREFNRYRKELQGLQGQPYSSLLQARWSHDLRLRELHSNEAMLEEKINQVYRDFGISVEPDPSSEAQETLRTYLARVAGKIPEDPEQLFEENVSPGSSVPSENAAFHSPISLESEEAKTILKQFRWKATQDPSFPQWSLDKKASYLLHQFSAYEVKEPDGTRRPWNHAEAVAFLGLVNKENLRRSEQLEPSLTLPQEGEGLPTKRLDDFLTELEKVHQEENPPSPYVEKNVGRLAQNAENLNRQMQDYYQRTNKRLAKALETFLPKDLLAQNVAGTSTTAALR